VFIFSSLLSGVSYSRVNIVHSYRSSSRCGLGMFYQTFISFKNLGKKIVAFQELILVPSAFWFLFSSYGTLLVKPLPLCLELSWNEHSLHNAVVKHTNI